MTRSVFLRFVLALSLFPALILSAQVNPALQRATVTITRPADDAMVNGTVWLVLPDQAGLEQEISKKYDIKSPSYHHFFNWNDLAPYLPQDAQVRAVKAALAANNLSVVETDPHNLSVGFSGRVSDVQSAFHTTVQLHTISSGTQVRTFTRAPGLEGDAAGLVKAVTGIAETPEEPGTAQSQAIFPEAASDLQPVDCISAPQSTLLTTPGQALPSALYLGPVYGAKVGGKLSSTGKCSYTPAQFFAQTRLDQIHNAGYTGKGQTIAILEEVGSPTIREDLAAFDQLYGLPAADLQVVDLTGDPNAAPVVTETTLDVEWAHAVAPDAKIVVVDASRNNLRGALAYVLENRVADVVSISYASSELTSSIDNTWAWNEELMIASGLGVNVNICTQDYGDYVALEGSPDVAVPADSPYATAVGGLSVVYVPGTNALYKTSWGTNLTLIGTNGVPLAAPQPIPHGTSKFGGGGGVSTIFPVPAYQSVLGGSGRHLPDISDYADGFTGLKIVVTDPSFCGASPCVEVAGGTSLATPIFAGKWALLNQLNGGSLGQAAPLIAQYAGTPAIEDIVPHPEVAVYGGILSQSGAQFFSAAQLASPETSQPFISALWQSAQNFTGTAIKDDDYVLSFGTDSSLAVLPGYDSATGWGQLNIAAIFSRFVQEKDDARQ